MGGYPRQRNFMAYGRRWKPSRTKAREFAEQMDEIADFCGKHGISQSTSGDSYYFSLNGKKFRVSNHSIEASNARAYTDEGEKVRPLYHEEERLTDTVYIHAGKTRIIEIYSDLLAGYELDGRGNRK